MTTPKESPREALPEPLKVVAYLVTNLRSGEPSLCFEDERGDYGDEDRMPAFDSMVLLTDALSALESERQAHAADSIRLDWMDSNPNRIKHSTGYRGAPDSWVWTDANGYGHDAANLRAAIDQAIAKEKP